MTEFSLIRNPESQLFELIVPSDVRLVTCGLFVGKPQILHEPKRIQNAGLIMPRVRAYQTRGGERLALGTSSLRFVDRSSEWFACSGVSRAPYLVEGAWLGCWASDGLSITGATELVSIDLKEIPQTQEAVDSCLAEDLSTTADRLCPLQAELGVCTRQGCQELAPDAGGPDAGSCTGGGCGPGEADGGAREVGSCSLATLGRQCVLGRSEGFGRCRGGYCAGEPLAGDFPADQLVVACSQASDGFSCRQTELGSFGTCYDGRCRRRCDPTASSDAEAGNRSGCVPDGLTFMGPLRNETHCLSAAEAQSPMSLPIGVCVEPRASGP